MKKLALLLVLMLVASAFVLGICAEDTFTNPVAPGADPFVFKDDDGTYYLYATGGDAHGYQVYSSKNLVEWTAHGYCLLHEDMPVQRDNAEYENYHKYWAPEVIKYNGKYYMTVSYHMHLGFAVADNPLGPFKGIGDDYVFPIFESIDGHFFKDDDGTVYFYFATLGGARFGDQYVSKGESLWGCELDMNTLTPKMDTISLILEFDPKIDGVVIEGPFMLKHNGTYYITFSSDGYSSPKYSVHYATNSSPLGKFTRDYEHITLISDDVNYEDIDNPHLYGTAHHSFVEAPNGKDLLIIYHCHRTNRTYQTVENLCSPRSVCIDPAWFDEDGILWAGRKDKPGTPNAYEQPYLEGTESERETYLAGPFASIPNLPKVYVNSHDGVDTNPGTKVAPIKTIARAVEMLTKGGTIVITQTYTVSYLDIPACRGPLMITSEHGNAILYFKYLSINSDVYFDNLYFAPQAVDEISVIECNFNNVTFGEGVSTLNRPYGDHSFPYLVGGRWQYTGKSESSVYESFRYRANKLTSTDAFTLTVLGGTWQLATVGSVEQTVPMAGTAANGKLITKAEDIVLDQAASVTEIKMTLNSMKAFVNGESKMLDAAPVIKNSRTMLPVRFVAENLGATVGWDAATQTVSIKSETATIEIVIGATTAKVNGNIITLDSPAYIEVTNNRTYLPVRVVAENLGATVAWDDATKTATLTK